MFKIPYMTLLFTLLANSAYAEVFIYNPNGTFASVPDLVTASINSESVKTVVVTSPQTVTTSITWPPTSELRFENNGCITFNGAGALTGLKEASPIWFGADITGISDSSTSMTKADAAANVVIIPSGTYKISSNVTFSKPVKMEPGALLIVSTGVTVAFNGGFEANILSRLWSLSGTATITFDATKTSTCFPEWWGAALNNNNGDTARMNTLSINASIVACKITELQYGDYWTSSPIGLRHPYRTLRGKGMWYDTTTNDVTRIVNISATSTIIQVGPDTKPPAVNGSDINGLNKGNVVLNLILTRSILPNVQGAVGLQNQYTLYAELTNIRSDASVHGFEFYNTVATKAYRLNATHYDAVTGGTDTWKGYYVDGSGTPLGGLNSGNASLYLDHCSANASDALTNAVGFYLDGGFADTFLETPETAGVATGIYVKGNAATDNKMNFTNIDLQISKPVIDNFSTAGLVFDNINKFGAVEVIGGYFGGNASATAGIRFHNSHGAININGGQIHAGLGFAMAGISAESSSGININKTIISDSRMVGIDVSNVTNSNFSPIIRMRTKTMSNAAIRVLHTSSRNTYSPTIYGSSSSILYGVQFVGDRHTYSEINASGINPDVFSGGSASKININDSAVIVTGVTPTGHNLISGVID